MSPANKIGVFDNLLSELKLLIASEIDSLFNKLCQIAIKNSAKVKEPVIHHVQRYTFSCAIKYGVQPRKIGCSQPASTSLRWGTGRAGGRPSSHSPTLGLGGRSKSSNSMADWGRMGGHHGHYFADQVAISASPHRPVAPLGFLPSCIQFDGGG